ncbi:MAG: PAS domain S-box protein [Planctomycetes bacterium]|nr:PAS domain S-box protein [Planctomycetota bacterium]
MSKNRPTGKSPGEAQPEPADLQGRIQDLESELSALKRELAQAWLIIDAAPNATLLVDALGRITLVNAQVEKLFGYTRQELLGQPVELLIPHRFRAAHPGFRANFLREPLARLMGAGRDLSGLRKDGQEFPVEIGLSHAASHRTFGVSSSPTTRSERAISETGGGSKRVACRTFSGNSTIKRVSRRGYRTLPSLS